MDNHKSVEEFILNLPNTKLTFPFGEDVSVYKVDVGDDWKMFALMPEKKTPVNLSLKCDPQLAKVLRERYESVMEGYHLNKKHWNTILLTGQLTDSEVKDLILHSYNLVTGSADTTPSFT
jgi:predicted DNA-binding protein (MmcQ/YjbR family)